MKTLENVKNNKKLVRGIEKVGYHSVEDFCEDAVRYIQAIRENRMFCQIISVSKTGMSRTVCFREFTIEDQKGRIYNFFAFFKALGYNTNKSNDGFVIGGCGMDMIFHTNYTIISRLTDLEFLSKEECEHLRQQTPTTI